MDQYLQTPLADLDDVTHYMTGKRGSMYAVHPNASTTGFREPSDMPGTGKAIQPQSGKTFYADKQTALKLQDWMSNEYIGTKLLPKLDENGKMTAVQVQITEPHPKRAEKKGQIVAELPMTTRPQKGLLPIELFNSSRFGFGESPVGTKGKYHIGNEITDVLERPPTKPSGGGGSGGVAVPLGRGANQSGGGGGRPDNLNPLSLQRLFAKGGVVRMPKEYSQGGWKLI